jgi:hypothetical protein
MPSMAHVPLVTDNAYVCSVPLLSTGKLLQSCHFSNSLQGSEATIQIQMSDMSTAKQLTGDILPPSSSHAEIPLGTAADDASASNNKLP